jgi:multisubunit Na+/H+ antiporter MnhF subunit
MQHSEQELRKRYSSLGDDDLLELYNGELTDFARVILKEELHKRSLITSDHQRTGTSQETERIKSVLKSREAKAGEFKSGRYKLRKVYLILNFISTFAMATVLPFFVYSVLIRSAHRSFEQKGTLVIALIIFALGAGGFIWTVIRARYFVDV